MKLRFLFVILLAGLTASLCASCGDDDDGGKEGPGPGPQPIVVKSVNLSSDRTEITADGEQEAVFTVTVDPASEASKAKIIDKATGKPLTGNKFSTAEEGTYVFYAECGSLKSAEVEITATRGDDPEPDKYEEFKADNTLRFERAGQAKLINAESNHHFYRDNGYFLSDKCKVGYANADATEYFMLEWVGGGNAGAKGSPSVRTQAGDAALFSLDILKAEDGIVWIVYRTTASGEEEFAVQEW